MVCQNIVFFTGAGISVESGIPTFRDVGGLWRSFDPAVYCRDYRETVDNL